MSTTEYKKTKAPSCEKAFAGLFELTLFYIFNFQYK
jgi:hypothetical protein